MVLSTDCTPYRLHPLQPRSWDNLMSLTWGGQAMAWRWASIRQ